MSNETSNDEMIERYLGGAMNAAEREQFERRLDADEHLRRSLRIEQAMTMAIAIDSSQAPARQPQMRSRAIDAIARIAPSAPVVSAPELQQRATGNRRQRNLLYSGLGLLMLLSAGGWFLSHPADTAPAPAAVESIVKPSPAASTAPGISTTPVATGPGVTVPVKPSEQIGNTAAGDVASDAPVVRERSRRSTPAEPRRSAVDRNHTGQSANSSGKSDSKAPPVFKQNEASGDVVIQGGK